MYKFYKKINEITFRKNLFNTLEIIFFILDGFLLLFLFNLLIGFLFNNHNYLIFQQIINKLILIILPCIIIFKYRKLFFNAKKSARFIDLNIGVKEELFLNGLELLTEEHENPFVKEIIHEADERSENLNIKVPHNLKPITYTFILISFFSTMFSFLIRDKISYAIENILSFPKKEVYHKNFIEVEPGSVNLQRNSSLKITILNPEEIPHYLMYKIDNLWREQELYGYLYEFETIDNSFDYFIKTDFAVSDTFHVEIFDLPIVKRIDLKYTFPKYTNLKPVIKLDSIGDIKAVEGTEVTIKIESNNDLNSAVMIFSDGKVIDMDRNGKQSFSAKITLSKNLSYYFRLTDFLNNYSERIDKQITVIPDEIPEPIIIYPGVDTLLSKNLKQDLITFSSDDFGITSLNLYYMVNSNEPKKIKLKDEINELTLKLDYTINFENEELFPGDVVTYWLEAKDNSPKNNVGISKKYKLRFPSIAELYREMEKQTEDNTQSLSENLKKAKEIQKEFENKRRDLMRKEEIEWEDKQELKNFTEEHEKLQEEVKKIAEDYKKMIDNLDENKALSSETLEKMEKIKELMEEISNEDLQKAMDEMKKAIDQLDKDVLKKAMENFKFSMEDYVKKLDQTLDLLESIKKEQSIQKSLEIAKEMQEMQDSVLEKTKENPSDNKNLFEEQQKTNEKLNELQDQLQKSMELLDPQKDKELREMMEKLQEMANSDSLKNDMQQALENLENKKMKSAMQNQQNISQMMKKMKNQLQEMSSMLSGSGMQQMSENINTAIKRLLLFAALNSKSKDIYSDDPFVIVKDLIANFEGINRTLTELYSNPQIAFVLSQKFVYDTNFTMVTFKDMFSDINDAKFYKMSQYLSNIQKGLNLMIFDLMQSDSNMQSGGGGGGMQQMMQMMQQMTQQQMAMNMITQQLLEQMGENGRPNSSMRQQMQRMASDQRRMAENLRRMIQNNPEAQKQANALNRLADDMDEIARQLSYNRMNKDIADMQERILSRLLSAQKSIHKRDKSKERKAEQSEKEWELSDDIKLEFEKLKRKALLKEDVQEYPMEYQEVIREYLKAINTDSSEEN